MKISQRAINIIPYFCLLIILSTVLMIYFPVGGYDWILGLDQVLIIDNLLIRDLSSNNILDTFLTPVNGRYEPMAMISYSLDMAIWPGNELKGIHYTNLVLHLINIILFFRLVHLLSKTIWPAVIAASLFAVHPVNAEAITWLSARSQLFASFFLLMGLLAYVYHMKSKYLKKRYLYLSEGFFLLAILTNPIALVFPFLILMINRHFSRGIKESIKYNYRIIYLGLVAIIVMMMIQFNSSLPHQDLFTRPVELFSYFFYSSSLLVVNFIVPSGLFAYHPYPIQMDMIMIILSVLMALIIGVVTWKRKKQPIIFYGLMAFVLSFFFSFSFSPGSAMYYDSQAYFPYLGLFLLIALFVQYLYENMPRRAITQVLTLIFILGWVSFLAVFANEHKKLWADNYRLWTSVIDAYPDNGHAFFMRGDHWARNGEYEKASFDYNQCVKRDPEAFMAHNNLGLIFMEEGDLRMAIREFNTSINIYNRFYKSYLNRGITLMRHGNLEKAMEDMNVASELAPDQPLIYYNRGLLYERLNDIPAAIEDFTKAINLDPFMIIFYKDRGKAFVWMSDFRSAERDFTKALELDPDNAEIWFRRSLARSSMDDYKGGLEDAAMAKSLGFPVEEDYIKGLGAQVLKNELPN